MTNLSSKLIKNLGGAEILSEGSTTARSLEERFADVVNVKDFGAIGDGVTDDTTSLIDAIQSSRGKTLLIPAGDYVYNSAVGFNIEVNNISIVNEGRIIVDNGLRLQGNYIRVYGGWYGRLAKATDSNIVYNHALSVTGNFCTIREVECENARGAGVGFAGTFG